MVYLQPGWESGVEASLNSLPILLDACEDVVAVWEAIDCWPIKVRKKEDVNANRTYFVKTVSKQFRERYGRPLHTVVAGLASVFFPNCEPELSEKMVAKIAAEK